MRSVSLIEKGDSTKTGELHYEGSLLKGWLRPGSSTDKGAYQDGGSTKTRELH